MCAGTALRALLIPPALRRVEVSLRLSVKAKIGSDAAIDEPETGRGRTTTRRFYGPYYDERSGSYQFRTLFPLWVERTQPSLKESTSSPVSAPLTRGIFVTGFARVPRSVDATALKRLFMDCYVSEPFRSRAEDAVAGGRRRVRLELR